jgi:undecaprenyl-diphosphatase
MSWIQTIVMALLQGMTELFPVSSLGHAVILPPLLHWNLDEASPTFLPFLVLLHLGTATALLILYWKDWVAIVTGFIRAGLRGRVETPTERLSMLLVAGTVPACVIGVLLQTPLQHLFANPRAAACFLIVNGLILLGAEVLRRRDERRARLAGESRSEQEARFGQVEQMSFRTAIIVGLFQALALLPGISRSGVTMAGGLVSGLRHQEAARFAFLLATPIIAGAGVVEVPELLKPGVPLLEYTIGAVVAGLAAYASARFLIRWFKEGRLDPYGVYCLLAGVLALIFVH